MQDYQPAEDLLAERVILVTGAGDGIGRAASIASPSPDTAPPWCC